MDEKRIREIFAVKLIEQGFGPGWCFAVANDTEGTQSEEDKRFALAALATVAAAVTEERDRCEDIIQAARFDEVDRDWRSIASMIQSGESANVLKEQAKI